MDARPFVRNCGQECYDRCSAGAILAKEKLMDQILLDGTTLASATRLLRDGERPTALNLFALSLLVEALILHDTITVIDTSTSDTRLASYASLYADCIVVRQQSVTDLLELYAARDIRNFASMKETLKEFDYITREGYWAPINKGAMGLDKALTQQYREDGEMAGYLDDLESFYSGRKAIRTTYKQVRSPRSRWKIWVAPRPATQIVKPVRTHYWQQNELIASDDMAQAGNYLIDRYSHIAHQSDWRYKVNTDRVERGHFRPSLLIRTHFYLLASDVLGMPYRPDALRTPICWKYFKQGSFSNFGIDEKFVDAAEKVAYENVLLNNRFLGRDAFIFVPFFLGRVLVEAKSADEIIPLTLEIRKSATARRFREYMAKLGALETSGEVNDLAKELRKYAELLRGEFEASSTPMSAAGISLLASGADLALSPTPGNMVKFSAGMAAQARPWWYRRKLALISKTLRGGDRAQLLAEHTKRIFKFKIGDDEINFLQKILTGPMSTDADRTQ
jgi:hypothetical protein